MDCLDDVMLSSFNVGVWAETERGFLAVDNADTEQDLICSK